ncbi:MAG TPA: hypothetical protein VHC47_10040 [Mucilaginibacter sp.]|nr:hypothetical protein [Mucilaginibacter sp.]
MKKFTFLPLFAFIFFAACKKDHISNPNTNISNNTKETDTLTGTITADKTLDASKNYFLEGQVYVKNNATLTIPAGITVYAQVNSDASAKSALIITQGSKIYINGTADKPVVFTSAAKNPAPGDWAAIILLGKAPTNTKTGIVEGFTAISDNMYGGNVPDDNSGSITYLRIEYTGGMNPPAEDEWVVDKASGLVLASVGSGTRIDNVMVKYSNDDSFQFVGGTVNASHLISYNCGDDDFDFDLGYEGDLQFLIGYRTQASSQALRANGVESYNDQYPTDNQPYTRPVISNMTIIGPQGVQTVKTNLNQGVYIRKGTRFDIRNSIVAEYPEGALMVCNKTRPILLADTGSEFRYNLVQTDTTARTFCWDKSTAVVADPVLTTFATNTTNDDSILVASGDFKLQDMYASGAPDLTPAGGSPALSGAVFTGTDFSNAFFTQTTYRGAIGTMNWAAASNWANWK